MIRKKYNDKTKEQKTNYAKALKNLYGNDPFEVIEKPKKKTIVDCPSETSECRALKMWCDVKRLPLVHIPNEGKRSYGDIQNQLSQGFRRGFPDYVLFVPQGSFGALVIEMKRIKKYTVAPEQLQWILWLSKNGYAAFIARGASEAIEGIGKYLRGEILRINDRGFLENGKTIGYVRGTD